MRCGFAVLLIMGGVVWFSGCETVTDLAEEVGVLTADQADSVNRSVEALEKTQEEFTPEQEYYIGRAVVATVLQSYSPLDDVSVNNYVNLVGQSLVPFCERPETYGGYHFLVLDSNEVNAFAAPGGFILICRGMIQCCENEDELAAVLSHEICHVEKKHGLKAIEQGRLTEALLVLSTESAKQFGSEELASLTQQFEDSVGDVVKTLTERGYSRSQESEADNGAVALLERSGYPASAMSTMLARMDVYLADAGGLGFAKTHPSALDRLESLPEVTEGGASSSTIREARFRAVMTAIMN